MPYSGAFAMACELESRVQGSKVDSSSWNGVIEPLAADAHHVIARVTHCASIPAPATSPHSFVAGLALEPGERPDGRFSSRSVACTSLKGSSLRCSFNA